MAMLVMLTKDGIPQDLEGRFKTAFEMVPGKVDAAEATKIALALALNPNLTLVVGQSGIDDDEGIPGDQPVH